MTSTVRRKLLVFDSWTAGSIHIIRLLEPLAARGIDVVFAHVGSWGDDPGRPAREIISGLEVRDIRHYRGLTDILETERPDGVLFLSLDPLLHRAFNRYCRQRRLPIVNLYPGLWSVQNYEQLGMDQDHRWAYWAWVAGRAARATRYAIPGYIRSLLRTGASAAEWKMFLAEFVHKAKGTANLRAPADAASDAICVYNEHDARHAVRKYQVARDRVTLVGIPDLIKFGGLNESVGAYAFRADEASPTVVYIGTGRRGTRLKLADEQVYVEHLTQTADVMGRMGKTLVCKLHYSRTDAIAAVSAGRHPHLRACGDADFISELQASCGAIIEPSTAALVPIVMGKPVFLAQYGRLAGLTFGPALAGYPRSRSIETFDGLRVIAEPVPSPADLMTSILEVAGPQPAAAMPERVADVIAHTLRPIGRKSAA